MINIQPDKYMHYSVCITIAILLGFIAWWFGLVLAISIGIMKEFIDSSEINNYFSWGDIIADVVGAVVGTLPHLIAFL